MILTYDEALNLAENKDWFKSFYKKEDLASDDEVLQINTLVKELGEDVLFDYFEIKEDMVLPKFACAFLYNNEFQVDYIYFIYIFDFFIYFLSKV